MTSLPKARQKGTMSLEETIARRRSVREFSEKKLDWSEIGQLAWAAQGITEPRHGFRAAPSAGALFPLEIYLVTPEGIFHYIPEGHKVEKHADGDVRTKLSRSALSQPWVAEAPLNLVIAAVHERVTRKYGPRGMRYVEMEVGHAAQNVLLQAVALGLGAVPIGAYEDKAVKQVLGLPPDHEPLYIISIGYPR